MKKEARVKISNMTYDRDNHLFQLYVTDLESSSEAIFAVKGTDWQIPADTSEDIIQQFCKDMTGKEKNLFIEVDNTSISHADRNESGHISEDGMKNLYNNLDQYPINEVTNIIRSKTGESENED